MIYPCVRATFYDFTAPLEGVVPWMYLDIRGLVTVGLGCLIDPLPLAIPLQWHWADFGAVARVDAIDAEWHRVKSRTEIAKLGHLAALRYTELRLSDDGIRALAMRRFDENAAVLSRRFDLASWPADAQLAVCSMAWAMGPSFQFPKFEAACARKDFDAAALECTIREADNPGIAPRNVANRVHLARAAAVLRGGLPLDRFYEPDPTAVAEDTNP